MILTHHQFRQIEKILQKSGRDMAEFGKVMGLSMDPAFSPSEKLTIKPELVENIVKAADRIKTRLPKPPPTHVGPRPNNTFDRRGGRRY